MKPSKPCKIPLSLSFFGFARTQDGYDSIHTVPQSNQSQAYEAVMTLYIVEALL